eukprot:4651537-Pyramimonas_sp.AAC.1
MRPSVGGARATHKLPLGPVDHIDPGTRNPKSPQEVLQRGVAEIYVQPVNLPLKSLGPWVPARPQEPPLAWHRSRKPLRGLFLVEFVGPGALRDGPQDLVPWRSPQRGGAGKTANRPRATFLL